MSDAVLSGIQQLLAQHPVRVIWILRKGNGLVVAYPSPALLKGNAEFRVVNTTGENADVEFPKAIEPAKKLTIGPYGSQTFRTGAGPAYVEYDVTVGGHSAEGGSKPGAIIDP